MICPRCGETIEDTETMCPFCMQDIDRNTEFNDFRQDGFVQIRLKNEADTSETINYRPKYLNIAELNVFVLAIVFVLFWSLFTIFSLRFVQKSHVEYVPAYKAKTEATTESKETQPTTEKIVKGYSIKDIVGSWKIKGMKETKNTAIPYYSFTEDGIAQENYGSITATGDYKDLSEKDKKTVYISIDGSIKGTFNFEFTENQKKEYTLILEDISTNRFYELKQADAKAKKISPSKDFKTDEKLVGYWLNKKEKKSYKFNSDGTAVRDTGSVSTECTWTVSKKGVITIKYIKDQVKSLNLDYIIKDDTLAINKTVYQKQNDTEETTAETTADETEYDEDYEDYEDYEEE